MTVAGRSETDAPLPAELAAPAPDADATVRIDAEEFARLEQRKVVERAWREQQEYASAVAELKKKVGWRESRRARAVLAAVLVAAVAIGAFLYNHQLEQERATRAEALRIAAESVARQEEEERAKPVPAEPAEDPADRARAEAEAEIAAKKAAANRAHTLALKIEEEARRMAEAAAKKQAAARAQAAATAKEAPRAVPRPGTVFQDCADCPRMVVIPAGDFTMGSPASEAERGVDEGPQRQVSIAQPFALGRSEVTVAEFRRFADETGYRTAAERDPRAQGCSGFIYADPLLAAPASQPDPGSAQ